MEAIQLMKMADKGLEHVQLFDTAKHTNTCTVNWLLQQHFLLCPLLSCVTLLMNFHFFKENNILLHDKNVYATLHC